MSILLRGPRVIWQEMDSYQDFSPWCSGLPGHGWTMHSEYHWDSWNLREQVARGKKDTLTENRTELRVTCIWILKKIGFYSLLQAPHFKRIGWGWGWQKTCTIARILFQIDFLHLNDNCFRVITDTRFHNFKVREKNRLKKRCLIQHWQWDLKVPRSATPSIFQSAGWRKIHDLIWIQ